MNETEELEKLEALLAEEEVGDEIEATVTDQYDYYSVDKFFHIFRLEAQFAWQLEELKRIESFLVNNKRGTYSVAIYGANGIGKTYFIALVAYYILWVKYLRKEQAICCMNSGTLDQAKSSIYDKLKSIHKNLPGRVRRLFTVNKENMLCVNGNDFKIVSASAANPHSLSGVHSDTMVRVLDEAATIPDEFYNKILTTFAKAKIKIRIALSNPVMQTGWFFHIVKTKHPAWRILQFKYQDVVDEEEFKAQAALIAEQYGEDSDDYKQSILGEYPENTLEQFFSEQIIERFTTRRYDDVLKENRGVRKVGVDLATGRGTDYSVIVVRDDLELLAIYREKITVNQAEELINWVCGEWGTHLIAIDCVGIAHGTTGNLIRDGQHRVFQVSAGEPAIQRKRYANSITELYDAMKEWMSKCGSLRDGTIGMGIHRLLMEELRSIRIAEKTANEERIILAPKKKYNRSPDMVDAIAHTFKIPHHDFGSHMSKFSHVLKGGRKYGS